MGVVYTSTLDNTHVHGVGGGCSAAHGSDGWFPFALSSSFPAACFLPSIFLFPGSASQKSNRMRLGLTAMHAQYRSFSNMILENLAMWRASLDGTDW